MIGHRVKVFSAAIGVTALLMVVLLWSEPLEKDFDLVVTDSSPTTFQLVMMTGVVRVTPEALADVGIRDIALLMLA